MTKDEIKLEYYTALKNLDYLYLNSVMLRALSEEMLKIHNGIIINVSMRPVVKSDCDHEKEPCFEPIDVCIKCGELFRQ